ncbi:MAG: hypothetical protein ACXQT5_03405, partial [Candidatus Syntropharchaeia archaeon]
HRITRWLCRFCSSAGTLAPTACAVPRPGVRGDFPQRRSFAPPPSAAHLLLAPPNQSLPLAGFKSF